MSNSSRRTLTRHGLRARATTLFFAHFFRLLLLAISLSQWCMIWWLFPHIVEALPMALQIAGPVLVYAGNRWLARRTRRHYDDRSPGNRMPHLYHAAAFTCLFCAGFLLATGALWITTKVFLEALTVQAAAGRLPLHVGSTIDALFRYVGDGGVAVIALTFAYGYTIGQQRLRITRIAVPLRNCPAELSGLRIVQISDIHIGQNLERIQLERFVTRVNALRPDLVCITGDIFDGPAADAEGFLPVLAGLRATHGIFAILGNHDHYAGADRVAGALRRLTPFRLLRDEHTAVEVGERRLHVIGLDDRGRDWMRGAVQVSFLTHIVGTLPADEPVILLCHRPDIFPQAAAGRVGLTLSGHTHGGQLGVPWFKGRVRNLAQLVTAFDRGLFERDGSYLYVNCGLGVTGQRIRLSTPREITLIELQRSPVERVTAPADVPVESAARATREMARPHTVPAHAEF